MIAPLLIVVTVACDGSERTVGESTAAPGGSAARPAATAPAAGSPSPASGTSPTASPATSQENLLENLSKNLEDAAGNSETAGTEPNRAVGVVTLPAGRVAYLALTEEVVTLDPSKAVRGTLSDALARALFAGLFRLTGNGIEPDLVDSWTASSNGLVHTFVLKDGLQWSDGVSLTAWDVEFGILRSLDPAIGSPDSGLLASVIRGGVDYLAGAGDIASVGVRAMDDVTIVIETTTPAAFLPAVLARPAAFPQPRHTAGSDPGRDSGEDLVTSGPFRVLNRVVGGNLALARNPGYDGPGVARLDGIVFFSAPDDAAAEMVDAGITNAIAGMAAPRSATDEGLAPNTAVEIVPGRAAYSLRFDVSQSPFDNTLVRRAFGAAIDRDALIAEAVIGTARIASTLTPPGVPGAVAAGSGIGVEYDLQRARNLLVEAGFPDFQTLPDFTLLYAPGEQDRVLAETISQVWRQAFGLIVAIAESERTDGVWAPRMGPAVWIERHESPYLDADGWLRVLYRSDSALNVGGYAEPAFDAAVDQGAVFTDPVDRDRAYRQAETILVGIDVAVFPLYVEDAYRWSQDGLAESLAPDGSVLMESWDIP